METLPRPSKLVLQIIFWTIFIVFAILRMIPRDYSVVTAAYVCAFLTLIQSTSINAVVKWKSAKFAFIKVFALLLVILEAVAMFTALQFSRNAAFNDFEVAVWLRNLIVLPPMLNFLVFVSFLNFIPDDQVISETSKA